MMDEELDDINIQILRLLQQDGRVSNTELAQRVGLAPPTVLRRVKLLEERGYIKGYVALVDPLALGLTVTAFIFVETAAGCNLSETETFLGQLPGLQEIHHLIGEWCFLLKVRTTSPQTLSYPRSKKTKMDGPAPLSAHPSSPGARNRMISCRPGTRASR